MVCRHFNFLHQETIYEEMDLPFKIRYDPLEEILEPEGGSLLIKMAHDEEELGASRARYVGCRASSIHEHPPKFRKFARFLTASNLLRVQLGSGIRRLTLEEEEKEKRRARIQDPTQNPPFFDRPIQVKFQVSTLHTNTK